MSKIKFCKGMKVSIPKYNNYKNVVGKDKGTIIEICKNFAIVQLDIGYRESFYYRDLVYLKGEN